VKRSGPPQRRTPLKSGGRLPQGKPLDRRTRIKPMSQKRRDEAPARQQVREETMRRAGHQCEAIGRVPEVRCWGPLDVDEIEGRGVHPGAHLNPELTQVLCRAHHNWKHANPAEARARGLTRKSSYGQ